MNDPWLNAGFIPIIGCKESISLEYVLIEYIYRNVIVDSLPFIKNGCIYINDKPTEYYFLNNTLYKKFKEI